MKNQNRIAALGKTCLMTAILIHVSASLGLAQCMPQQVFKLLANDGSAGDRFGSDVKISGDLAIVGARWDDDNGEDSGSAYLFDIRTGEQLHKLLPEDGAATDQFGVNVGICGDLAIVGTRSLEFDGDGNGSAYLFDTTTGEQLHKLLPVTGPLNGGFNIVVGVSGNVAIVGDQESEVVYLFDTTTGQHILTMVSEDHVASDQFGHRVAISGNVAIAGASGDDDNGSNSGSAYLFDAITGQQIHKLLPNDGAEDDQFGRRVEISDGIAIVGTNLPDDNGLFSGSAYLFDTTTGVQIHKWLPEDNASGDHFGDAVGVSGNLAIVGARGDDDNGDGSGSAYLFDTITGEQIHKFLPADGAADDAFGAHVAIDGSLAVISASGDDDNGIDSGSVYVFDISNCSGVTIVPDSLSVFRGFHISGNLSDSFESDDSYLKFNPGMTINSSEAPVWLIFDGTRPSDNPSSLEIVMESNAGTPGLIHTLEAWNWTSAAYDVVDVSAASFNDDVVITADLSSAISDYAEAGTGAVRTRVGWRKTGLTINYPWEVRLDQMVWIVQ